MHMLLPLKAGFPPVLPEARGANVVANFLTYNILLRKSAGMSCISVSTFVYLLIETFALSGTSACSTPYQHLSCRARDHRKVRAPTV